VSESGERNEAEGRQVELKTEMGLIFSNLRIGADVGSTVPLLAQSGISSNGVMLAGSGFIVSRPEACELGYGAEPGLEAIIRDYRNGRDLTTQPREVMVVDAFRETAETLRKKHPRTFQYLLDHVKPLREENNRKSFRDRWWIFGEPRKKIRPALETLSRYIATVETAKHRVFQFLPE
jgi:hypothetical protein